MDKARYLVEAHVLEGRCSRSAPCRNCVGLDEGLARTYESYAANSKGSESAISAKSGA